MDLYAIPITLRYKAEKKFYTNFGALTSLFLIITIFSFTIKFILEMLNGLNVSQEVSRKLNSKKPPDVHEESPGKFMFGYQI